MEKKNPSPATGLSLPVVVFVVFLILKLTNLITWSWWLITAPLWGMALIIILSIVAGLCLYYQAKKKR